MAAWRFWFSEISKPGKGKEKHIREFSTWLLRIIQIQCQGFERWVCEWWLGREQADILWEHCLAPGGRDLRCFDDWRTSEIEQEAWQDISSAVVCYLGLMPYEGARFDAWYLISEPCLLCVHLCSTLDPIESCPPATSAFLPRCIHATTVCIAGSMYLATRNIPPSHRSHLSSASLDFAFIVAYELFFPVVRAWGGQALLCDPSILLTLGFKKEKSFLFI